MQLGTRLFPYPILNNLKDFSDFKEGASFNLKLTLDENEEIIKTKDKVVLKDIHFLLEDEDLIRFYKEGKIACFLIVESPSSIFRQKFTLTDTPQTFEISIGNLKDDVYISAYCIAKCDIDNYRSKNFDDDYLNYSFDIKKYDIVAADDGMKFVIDRNLDEDNKVSSIFVIIKSDVNEKTISYEMNLDRIYIYIPPSEHNKYNSLKAQSGWNSIFFSMIAIPVLTACFSELKNTYGEEFDASIVTEQYRWFKSVLNSYKKQTNRNLDADTFTTLTALELSQIVLNFSSVNGIKEFCDLVIKGGPKDEQD